MSKFRNIDKEPAAQKPHYYRENQEKGKSSSHHKLPNPSPAKKIRAWAICALPTVLNTSEPRFIKVMSATFTIFYWRKK